MTRDEIIEAGARAVDPDAFSQDGDDDYVTRGRRKDAQRYARQKAAAMLDAITEGKGNKLMGRKPTKRMVFEMLAPHIVTAQDQYETAWDAAPWVPGEKS